MHTRDTVNGEVSSVAETLHAYGFSSDDGLEVLVHVGLDTVALKGEGFKSHVKEGDRVRVGDLIAEVDLDLLKSKGIHTITPVLVCDGAEDKAMEAMTGKVRAGGAFAAVIAFILINRITGAEVFGQHPLWLAWVTDLIN